MSKGLEKLHLIRSKIISTSGKTYPYYFIIAASLAAFYNIWFLILVVFLIVKFKNKVKAKYFLILGLLILSSFSYSYLKRTIKPPNKFRATITEVNKKYNQYVVRRGVTKYLIKSKDSFQIGDVVLIEGEFSKPVGMKTPYGFDQRTYYLSRGISYESSKVKVSKIGYQYLYYPKLLFNNYFDIFPEDTKVYMKALFLGINDFNETIKTASKSLQISYLLGLSGMMIYAVINILKKIFFYLDIKMETQGKIIIVFLIIWSLLTGFKFVVTRVLVMTIITNISRNWNLKFSRLDVLFWTFLLLVLLNFNYVYQFGFSLSFIILTVMYLASDLVKFKYYLTNRYFTYFIGFLFIFPLLLKMQNEIYLLIFIVTPIIVLIFHKAVIYLFIIVFIIPFLSPLLDYYLKYLEIGLDFLTSFPLYLKIPNFPNLLLMFYYFVLILIFTSSHQTILKISILILINFSVYNKAYFKPYYRLYFLDVEQGDTTIFITPFNRHVIVIDAYGDILPTLNRLGIRKIDYLILTHPDSDHVKKAPDLINNLKVNKVLINPYDDYNLSKSNIIKYKSDDMIIESDFKITFYGPLKNYYNDNDNSLAFKLEYLDESVLFLGDISVKVEEDIVRTYGSRIESKFLKLAHHGSKTSTSQLLLNNVKPDKVIISSGKNNIYGFPHQEVLNRIETNYEVLRTDQHYTIYYYVLNKDLKWLNYYENYIKYYIIV